MATQGAKRSSLKSMGMDERCNPCLGVCGNGPHFGNMFFGKIYHNDIYHWFGFLSQVGEKSRHWYSYIADFWLVGVIPVTLYPFYGGKVWCRYWCPLAKWMEFWSHRFGKLKISSNEKCIICGECSRYCEVGIDVMSFAKNQEDFSNKNTSCIQCGICITVCPLDVLSFQNGDKVDLVNL